MPETNAAPQGAGTPSPPTTNATPRKRGWGEPSQKEDWVKVRSLVGKVFEVKRISEAVITPKEGEGANVPRPSYIFELSDGHLFSVGKDDSIGHQLGGFGIPPTPAKYTIVSQKSTVSRTGDALLLRPAQ